MPSKQTKSSTSKKDPDAGLRALHHYERKLPPWRYRLRQRLIPIVRWETPYLAHAQGAFRSPMLDSYFALTANLGTHTFFMMALPICFWCGYPDVGLALVHMLGIGVYASGFVKDLLCLPRPLSPPLHRITMSGSAALEYGFPSTHTTNAVSAAVFCLYRLSISKEDFSPWTYSLLSIGCYCYAISITIGRMYCGMHGFFDVAIGALLGAAIALLRILYGPYFDYWILADGLTRPAITVLVLALLVRFHPEPADNCPCFDDSIAFLGVIMGIELGTWHYAQAYPNTSGLNPLLEVMYSFSNEGLEKPIARVLGGIVVVFSWRAIAKPSLLTTLPPIFRFVDQLGVRMPRRFFLQSRDYKQVPPLRKDDNVLPSASEVLSSIRNPRSRRVSTGPQSEADVREFIANRQQQRHRSSSDLEGHSLRRLRTGEKLAPSPLSNELTELSSHEKPTKTSVVGAKEASQSPTKVTAEDNIMLTPPASDASTSSDSGKEDERGSGKIFESLEKPRIHYDVEVITKLIVYSGIAWFAVEGNPLLFHILGVS